MPPFVHTPPGFIHQIAPSRIVPEIPSPVDATPATPERRPVATPRCARRCARVAEIRSERSFRTAPTWKSRTGARLPAAGPIGSVRSPRLPPTSLSQMTEHGCLQTPIAETADGPAGVSFNTMEPADWRRQRHRLVLGLPGRIDRDRRLRDEYGGLALPSHRVQGATDDCGGISAYGTHSASLCRWPHPDLESEL